MHEVTIVPAHRLGAVKGKGPEQIVLLENLLDRRRLRRGSGEQSRRNKQRERHSLVLPRMRPDRATHYPIGPHPVARAIGSDWP
jgi:hypothetical protein